MNVRFMLHKAVPHIAWTMLALMAALSGAATVQSCEKVTLTGEVNAAQEWKAAFGQGWIFRVVPVRPGDHGYTGWDLVVDREQPAGFPDALLLATPPYNSINEHEVGTTFGLRAQDAIGWNPRSFRFLIDPDTFQESQRLFKALGGTRRQMEASGANGEDRPGMQRLLKLSQKSSAGQFRILDARLAPGTSDAASYAENWALASQKTQHAFEPAARGVASPWGELHWMKFSITLWLPATWKPPSALHAVRAACSE